MNKQTFDDLLHRLGAELEHWPLDQAEAARQLIAADPVAARMQADFRRFESDLKNAVRLPSFGSPEIGQVLAALDRDVAAWRPTRLFWITGASATALSFAAGVILAFMLVSAQGSLDISSSIAGLALGQGDIGGLL